MRTTDFHAKYYANVLSYSMYGSGYEQLAGTLSDANVDLNPHQIEAALFALRSPFSKGVVMGDEVGLGKTIEACIVIAQKWAEQKQKILIIVPANLKVQWQLELFEKFFLPAVVLDSDSYKAFVKTGNLNPFEQDKIVICSYNFAYDYDEMDFSQNPKSCIIKTADDLKKILTDYRILKTTMQKLEKLLLYFYMKTEYIGYEHEIDELINNPHRVYAMNADEVMGITHELVYLDYIHTTSPIEYNPNHDIDSFLLTAQGMEHAEQLLATDINSKKAFVAMGFSSDLLEACEKAIKPACRDCGFDAFLISDKEHNQGITDEIIVAIKTSKFVITDFTYNNCGAYFEAGYAQGQGLEVIRLCKKEWFDEKDENGKNKNALHFDIRHYNLILWENHKDLIRKLKARIRATIPNAILEDKGR